MTLGAGDKLVSWRTVDRGLGGAKVLCDEQTLRGKWLYHRLSWRFAKAIFEKQRLRLSPVHSWRDPYEKWWCDLLFQERGALAGVSPYGLCWTTSRYDEPAWRMVGFGYARDEPIVRIRCSVDAILAAGCQLVGATAGAMFLGNVDYRRERLLVGLAQSVIGGERKEVTRTAASLMLQKRNAFRFEKEVRLLWLDRDPLVGQRYLPIDPAAAISQVMTGPYATRSQHREIRSYLREHGIESLQSAVLRQPT